jgi:hypothetical protein
MLQSTALPLEQCEESMLTALVEGAQVGPEPEATLIDSSQQIDWTGFMDDFDWSFTSNYLNVS